MNQSAERHLVKAETYLDKGEEFYRKAVTEIVSAQEADPDLSFAEIGRRLGKSRSWVSKIVSWGTSGDPDHAPTEIFATNEVRDRSKLRVALRDAPMETVEQIISELPRSRQRQIGAAAGEAYTSRVNEIADNTRRNVTEGISGMFGAPGLLWEKRALIKKIREIKEYLDAHGDEMIPDPDGGPTESIRDLSMGSYEVDRADILNAFAELGIGTSIEEGFNSLLSES